MKWEDWRMKGEEKANIYRVWKCNTLLISTVFLKCALVPHVTMMWTVYLMAVYYPLTNHPHPQVGGYRPRTNTRQRFSFRQTERNWANFGEIVSVQMRRPFDFAFRRLSRVFTQQRALMNSEATEHRGHTIRHTTTEITTEQTKLGAKAFQADSHCFRKNYFSRIFTATFCYSKYYYMKRMYRLFV